MAEKTMIDILKSISYSGEAESPVQVIIADKQQAMNNLIDLSSGTARLKRAKYSLLFSQPRVLGAFSNLEIRCCLCGRVISYPCFYHVVEYAKNHFHYFICSDPTRLDKVTTDCMQQARKS